MTNPHALIMDTNILIYLIEPNTVPREVFNHFLSCIIHNKIKLIIPEQVKDEWDRHKIERSTEYQEKAIKEIENHRKLATHVDNEKEKDNLIKLINFLRKTAERKYLYTYGLRARNLDRYIAISLHTTIPNRNSNVDKLVVNMSLEKAPPFFGSDIEKNKSTKNEIGDAVLFFTAYDYIKNNSREYNEVFFVTANKKDFSPHGNDFVLHPNLQKYADEIDLKFYNNLQRFLNVVDPDKSYYHEIEIEDSHLYLTNVYFEDCTNCGKEYHIHVDEELLPSNSGKRQTYHKVCPHCKSTFDTWEGNEDRFGI